MSNLKPKRPRIKEEIDSLVIQLTDSESELEDYGDDCSASSCESLKESDVPSELDDHEFEMQYLAELDEKNIWTDTEQDPPNFTFNEKFGLNILIPHHCEIEHLVNLFFSTEFLVTLVEQTNLYASQVIAAKGPLRRSNMLYRWKPTDVEEMKTFLALLLHMGPCSLPNIDLYWSTSRFYHTAFWRSYMSRNRFRLLLRFLHFADITHIETDDRLCKVRPVIDHFNNIMNLNYTPDQNLFINESTSLRLFYRQSLDGKKYGMRLYELCQSNGLVIKIHCSRAQQVTNSTDVVLELMENYLDRGHVLRIGDFFTSVRLTHILSTRRTHICGALRADKCDNPEVVVKSKLDEGECRWKRSNTAVVCKWRDRHDILVISNMHKVKMVKVRIANGKVALKPNIIRDSSTESLKIDKNERMHYAPLHRKRIGWQKTVCLQIFETYIHNAYIIYRQLTGSKEKCLEFREKFMECLLGDKVTKVPKKSSPRQEALHYLECIEPSEKKQRPTKQCRVCTRKKIRRETRYYCPVCVERPALCVQHCFKEYHT